jgi:hypothetical protein
MNKLPPTAPIQRAPQAKSREFVMKSQKAMIDTWSWECCLNCDHWKEVNKVQVADVTKYSGFTEVDQGPMCTKYMMRPPTENIVIGCSEYEPAIPF